MVTLGAPGLPFPSPRVRATESACIERRGAGGAISLDTPLRAYSRNRVPAGDKTEYLLWVAEDGSTYWANTNADGTHHGDAVTRSALYAMQYDDANLWHQDPDEDYRWDGLACGAFDARVARWGLAQARSPAVDAGSEDAWQYDSTSTNPKVIDMSQPDIGYKYYRRVADDDPPVGNSERKIEISFRQPDMGDFPDVENLRYVIRLPGQGGEPDQEIESYSYTAHLGEAVIMGPMVEGEVSLLSLEKRYDLQAYSTTVGVEEPPPEDTEKVEFIVIVDSEPPTIAVE